MTRLLKLALLGTLSSLLLACSDDNAEPTAGSARDTAALEQYDPLIQSLYDKALAAGEKELVLYTPFPETIALWQAFNRDFPGIRLIPSLSTQIYTRLDAESRSGNYSGDLVLAGYGTLAELVKQQRIEQDIPATSLALDEAYKDPHGYYQIPWSNAFTLAYNRNKLSADEVPSSWAEILDERWKGRFGIPRFVGASPQDAALVLLQESGKLSDDDLQKLHANAQVADDNQILIAQLAQGRFDFVLFVPAQSVARLIDTGAPLGLSFPHDVAIHYGPGVGLLKHAPHPNAANLFKHWLFTPQAQAIITSREYAYGTLPDAPTPEGFPALDTFDQVHLPFAEVNDYFVRYRQKTAAIWK